MVRIFNEEGAEDILVFGGGIIPKENIANLTEIGIKEVLGPGTNTQGVVDYILNVVASQGNIEALGERRSGISPIQEKSTDLWPAPEKRKIQPPLI